MSVLKEKFVLSNGIEIPKIAFGTWQIPNGDVAYDAVRLALKHQYRHIDTAAAYKNEPSVGKAIKDSGIPREEIFVTTKLESHIKTYQGALDAFDKTLKDLGLSYVDLYLIHAPWPWSEIGKNCDKGNIDAWKALEVIYKSGRAKAIGVSNFSVHDLENIMAHTNIVPHVNQIALHIGRDQSEIEDYCKKHKILVEAYSPLGTGKILDKPEIVDMAKKYQVTPAQICIRYCLEKHTLPLPKSTHESRMIENSHVDFRISADDMKILETI
jgi:diketogulonate reductase-like aldo/keto reductase